MMGDGMQMKVSKQVDTVFFWDMTWDSNWLEDMTSGELELWVLGVKMKVSTYKNYE